MREILFRGKKCNNGKWIEGGIYTDENKTYIIYTYRYIPDTRDWDTVEFYENHPRYEIGYVAVDPETIGQFTGMTDKNGKKIFEGDIVVLNEDVKKTFNVDDGEVRYGWGGFYIKEFSSLNSLNVLASYDCILRGEVIGNKYDNPELLSKD